MKIKIVGLQKREGKSKKTDKAFKGTIVYGLCLKAEVVGQATIEQYIDAALFDPSEADVPALIGREANVFYDQRGYVDTFEVLSAPGK